VSQVLRRSHQRPGAIRGPADRALVQVIEEEAGARSVISAPQAAHARAETDEGSND